MKALITLVFVLTIAFQCLMAQGFDWQYSTRLPSSSPTLFLGIKAESQLFANSGNFRLTEPVTFCCNFGGGWGSGWELGLSGEWWQSADLAYNASIYFAGLSGEFSQRDSKPLSENEILTTEFVFNSMISYLNFEFGMKNRIFDSHFNWGGALQVGLALKSDGKYFERVVSPDYFYFPTNPKSQERVMAEGRIPDLNTIIIYPKLFFGYDFTYGLGKFATIYLSTSIPLMTITTEDEWRRWVFSAGLKVYQGIR